MRVEGLPRRHFWSQFVQQRGLSGLEVERGLVFDTEILTVQYVLSGAGIALVDLALFRDHLDAGRLACPYDTTLDDGFGYYLVTDPEALSDTATALFRSWLIEQFGQHRQARPRAGQPRATTPGVPSNERNRIGSRRGAPVAAEPAAPARAGTRAVAWRIGICMNPFEPPRIYSDDQVAAIHEAALTMLENQGMKVLSAHGPRSATRSAARRSTRRRRSCASTAASWPRRWRRRRANSRSRRSIRS